MRFRSVIVSVLTTAYNRELYIGEAIESILSSTFSDFELIIVDDCSTDNTVEIARGYEKNDDRVKVYVNEKNLGDYPNRNRAASYANGKYIKYLDSDDIIYPHGLGVMVRSMEQFPEAGYGLSSLADPDQPLPQSISPRQAYLEHFSRYGHFNRAPGSAIIRKSAFDSVGGFSGKRMIGDYELWLILSRQFHLVKFQRDLVWDRTHPDKELFSRYALNYDNLRKQVLTEAFSHRDCPISEKEIGQIHQKLKKNNRKNRVLKILSKLNR